MAQSDTWSNPNYAGELFLVGGNRTPFLNMLGGLGSGKTVNTMDFPIAVPWSLASGSQPAISELTSMTAPTADNFTRGQDINTCQIFHKAITVTYTKLSTPGAILTDLSNGLSPGGTNPVQNEVDFQVMAQLKQIAYDVNYTFINGVYQQATTVSGAAKTRGMISAISTNSTASGTLDKAAVNDCMIQMADAGAPMENLVMFCSSAEKVALTNLYGLQPLDYNVGGMNIERIFTDFAPLGVVYDPQVPAGTILILDMNYISPVFCPVPGKGILFYEELSKTGAAVKGQIYGQIGLDYGPEEYHGKIVIS